MITCRNEIFFLVSLSLSSFPPAYTAGSKIWGGGGDICILYWIDIPEVGSEGQNRGHGVSQLAWLGSYVHFHVGSC